MIEIIREMFSAPILVRALIVGILVSLCAALLGVSLVLKRYAMIGDGLSHVGFGALAVATVANLAPIAVAIPVVILAAFLLLRLSSNSRIKGDSAIALISTGALAVGVMAVSMSKGANVDLNSYLFGSIISVSRGDVAVSVILALAVIFMFVFFYTKIFAITFRESDGHKRFSLQYADSPADRRHNRYRYAPYGKSAYIEPYYLPRAVLNAHFQEFQKRDDMFRRDFRCDVHNRNDNILRVGHSVRSKHSMRKYRGVRGVQRFKGNKEIKTARYHG